MYAELSNYFVSCDNAWIDVDRTEAQVYNYPANLYCLLAYFDYCFYICIKLDTVCNTFVWSIFATIVVQEGGPYTRHLIISSLSSAFY